MQGKIDVGIIIPMNTEPEKIVAEVGKVVKGKAPVIRRVLAALPECGLSLP